MTFFETTLVTGTDGEKIRALTTLNGYTCTKHCHYLSCGE